MRLQSRPASAAGAAHRRRALALTLAGAAALAGAGAVYGVLRPMGVGPSATGWLPSALHALAFVLWIGLALGWRGRAAWALAAGWATAAGLIEAMQHPAWHALLPAAVARHWQGTFSWADVAAGLAGAAAAALALGSVPREGGRE